MSANLLYEYKIDNLVFETYDGPVDFKVSRVKQVHGSKIAINPFEHIPEADGIVGELPMAILTADCLPVAALGNKGQALIHAGWRGVQQRIFLAPEVTSILPHTFIIGPHIRHYEVGPEFESHFPNSKALTPLNDKFLFNLSSEATLQILSVFPDAKIINEAPCTFEGPKFNSYRRDQTKLRNWNILRNW